MHYPESLKVTMLCPRSEPSDLCSVYNPCHPICEIVISLPDLIDNQLVDIKPYGGI